jgi:hypothetical protein
MAPMFMVDRISKDGKPRLTRFFPLLKNFWQFPKILSFQDSILGRAFRFCQNFANTKF